MKTPLLGMVAAIFVAASGCGPNVVGGTGGQTGTGGSTGGESPCPTAEPSGGNVACTGVPEGFRCTYGESVRPECRHESVCSKGTWTTTKSVCVDPPPQTCGGPMPVNGDPCAGLDGAVCVYGDDICLCSACGGGPCMENAVWSCAVPPTGAGCPPVVPNDGSPCDAPAADCSYGFPCGGSGAHVTCKDGTWLWDDAIGCPL